MKAAIRDKYGSPDVVEVREVERPTPKDDEILVRVRAASVNRADLDYLGPRPGFLRLIIGVRAPRDPRMGIDVAGEVESVGAGVTRFRPGDRVFADVFSFGQGAFAEYVCAKEKAFLPMPAGLSFEDAATLPHSAILALQGLRRRNGRHGPARRQGPDRRRLGQRRAVRRPDRQVVWRRGDRRVQHGQGRFRALARRGPRARLHRGGLHQDRGALRLDPRHRLPPLDPEGPARAATERHVRHARRDGLADHPGDRSWGRSSRWAATAGRG